ncbi:MAG: aminomethyl-transferring glycine dehydrogenase subunit GcvPA [Thermoprotei archaeon]|nr:MAG: aminomethyl-transferring glycine dehydrogenase subunit GcvPA [Thermoprotei archaeon]
MPHPWIPNSDPEIKKYMLSVIGVNSIEELFEDIPEKYRLKHLLKVGMGKPLSELEAKKVFEEKLRRVYRYEVPPFLGGEYCLHYVPEVVKSLLLRDEFYTAYTPYQPEINQGLLQALFEYQSLMTELYGVEVVNASMYDGSTALAEAVRMALRATRRRKIVVSKGIGPMKMSVLRTWLKGLEVKIVEAPLDLDKGTTSLSRLYTLVDGETAALVTSNPTFYGSIESEIDEQAELIHRKGGLFIVFADPISLGVLKAPGEYGADIVVGEGQPLGLGLYYGGSTLGILGTRKDLRLIRQLPGRLVGMTTTLDGTSRGFALVLQTREQHIRRERATSNITTNSALAAIAVAIYVTYMGGAGLKRLARSIAARTVYLIEQVSTKLADSVRLLFAGAKYFKQVPLRFNRAYEQIFNLLLKQGVVGGTPLSRYEPEYSDVGLFCVTEVHSKRHIDKLVESLREVIKREHMEAS